MPVETWISPNGHFKVDRVLPEKGYENETREEWAERIGLDLSVFQHEDPRTPEERAEFFAKASAELDEYIKEEGLELNEEEQADFEALAEYMGWNTPNSEPAPQ